MAVTYREIDCFPYPKQVSDMVATITGLNGIATRHTPKDQNSKRTMTGAMILC